VILIGFMGLEEKSGSRGVILIGGAKQKVEMDEGSDKFFLLK